MKWEVVSSTISHSAYTLWNNGKKLVTLVFNPSSNAARIEYADERRVFLIRKEGFLRRKTVVRNEYGILIGEAGKENNEHFITVNDERYFYKVGGKREPNLTIYKKSQDLPVAVCEMEVAEDQMLSNSSGERSFSEKMQYSLLLTLCWYLFQPVAGYKL